MEGEIDLFAIEQDLEPGTNSHVLTTKKCTMCPSQVVHDEKAESQKEVSMRRKYIENLIHQLYLSHIIPFLPQSNFPLCPQCMETLRDYWMDKAILQSLFQTKNDFGLWIFFKVREGLLADLEASEVSWGFAVVNGLPTYPTLTLLRNAVGVYGGTPNCFRKVMGNYQPAGIEEISNCPTFQVPAQPDFNLR